MPAAAERSRCLLCLLLAFGALLHLPSLRWGFYADDFGHRLVLEGVAQHATMRPWNLFDFGRAPGPGDPTWESGAWPWWTDDDWKGRFFRPLTSLVLWGEHALFGRWAPGHHGAGIFWFALLLLVVHALYRELELSSIARWTASFFFAAHASTLIPVGWVANRNTVIALLFTAGAVVALHRSGLGLALLSAFLACLGKESGVAAFALIVASLLAAPRLGQWPRARRRRAITISCLAAALYLGFLLASGFGTRTLFYVTPGTSPGAFVERLGHHVAVDFLGLLLPPLADLLFVEQWLFPLFLLLTVLVLWLGVRAWRMVRQDAGARFFAVWIALTLLPQVPAPTSGRLLMAAAIGSSALGALLFARLVAPGAGSASRCRIAAAAALVLVLGVVHALVKVGGGSVFSRMCAYGRETLANAELPPRELGRRETFLLNLPTSLVGLGGLAMYVYATGDEQLRLWPLQFGRRGARFWRVDDRTFDLEALDGVFLSGPVERVFLTREPSEDTRREWRTSLFRVTVSDLLRRGNPGFRRIRVELPESLDSPRYSFLAHRDGRLRRVEPPAVGEFITVPAAVAPSPFFP